MPKRAILGLLTPSSNTVLEPMTAAILRGADDVTAHFGRFRVREISMSSGALSQFDFGPQLDAADLLADAHPDVIAWAGTSGAWLGIETDRRLCAQITERTGVPATTSTLAMLEAFRALGTSTYGLVTPYVDDVQTTILDVLGGAGLRCAGERHLGESRNFAFSEFPETLVAEMIREVAKSRPGAIVVHCTNLNGTRVAPGLERETGIPVIDSISVTVWHMLLLAGADPARFGHWGRVFALPDPAKAPASEGAK